MKKIVWIAVLLLGVFLAGCGKDANHSGSAPERGSAAEKKTALLYTNLTTGTESPDIKEHKWEYTGELNAQVLAEGLSRLTGLDFVISASAGKEGLVVDWGPKSTLLANLDDRKQKEDFRFADADSLRWFMMDSLWLTLTKNLKVENLYYTMNGGRDLVFEELDPVRKFPADLPYMGSAFFFAHADGKGEVTDGKGDLIDEDKSEVTKGKRDLIDNDKGGMTDGKGDLIDEDKSEAADGRGDLIDNGKGEGINEAEAMEMVRKKLTERGREELALVGGEEDKVEGENAIVFPAGEKSADGKKFTARYYFAVTDRGAVYYKEAAKGADWTLLE